MAEENQIRQMTTKDPKKVEVGKRLAEYNHRMKEDLKAWKREELKAQKSEELKSEVLTSNQYSIEAVLAVVVIGLGYYLYQDKKGTVPPQPQPNNPPQQPSHRSPKANKFEME